MDATAVRAEIKTWEHEFRARYGRSATVDDVRAVPDIAEKYRLYKRLTKEAERGRGGEEGQKRGVQPPRTPSPVAYAHATRPDGPEPARASPAAVILLKSRPVASSSWDADTRNPFSPAKKTRLHASQPSTSMGINPFITPVKMVQRLTSPHSRSPSPHPAQHHLAADDSAPVRTSRPNAAITKARKRLRGESVSPSPVPRDKRRRANGLDPPSRMHDRLPRGQGQSRSDGSSSMGENDGEDEEESFVADSPVKVTAGAKAFVPLFEETRTGLVHAKTRSRKPVSRLTLLRTKTLPGGGMLGLMGKATGTSRNEKGKGGEEDGSVDGAQKTRKRTLPGPRGLIPLKDDLFEGAPPATAGTSRKRTLSKAVEEDADKGLDKGGSAWWNLLPPSPPPQQDDAVQYNARGRRKTSHKKARVEEEETSSDSVEVTLVAWRAQCAEAQENEATLTVDTELQLFRVREEAPETASVERFEVDLPEEMRQVLVLEREGEREREEGDVVEGLMRGRRKVGGDVWAPGEMGGEEGEDWEGEGIPWQAAEL